LGPRSCTLIDFIFSFILSQSIFEHVLWNRNTCQIHVYCHTSAFNARSPSKPSTVFPFIKEEEEEEEEGEGEGEGEGEEGEEEGEEEEITFFKRLGRIHILAWTQVLMTGLKS